MRRLLLFRHAKAERPRPGGNDHERPLAERGRADSQTVGLYMKRHRLRPDLALVSTSVRTRETWALAAAAFADAPPVEFDERIYEATPHAILQVIRGVDPQVETLVVVGHNPGLQELANLLVASGDIETRQRLQEKFPTAGLAVIDFAGEHWGRLHPEGGRIEHFVTPRSLASASD